MKDAEQFLRRAVEDSLSLKKSFFEEKRALILDFYRLLRETRNGAANVWIFGNGGSAADAQHFAAELMHRVEEKSIGIKARALHTDTSLLTALANDEGYDAVYAAQIRLLARPGDVCVAITTSGNSRNVVQALQVAREKGCRTVGLLGRDGGKCAEYCDLALIVPHRSTPRIQEVHGMIVHLVCQMLEL